MVIPIRAAGDAFDFAQEARVAALNEACESFQVSQNCTLDSLCISCQALANSIESRLRRAFIAGQSSMKPRDDS